MTACKSSPWRAEVAGSEEEGVGSRASEASCVALLAYSHSEKSAKMRPTAPPRLHTRRRHSSALEGEEGAGVVPLEEEGMDWYSKAGIAEKESDE
jgi:hypothetical protein